MDWMQAKDALLLGVVTLAVSIIGFLLGEIRKDFREMTKAIQDLNTKLAIIITKHDSLERRVDHLESKK